MKRINERIVKKKNKIKLNIKFIIVFFIMFIVVGIIVIKNLFTIKNIHIIINVSNEQDYKITKEEIMSLAGLNIGDKLFKNLRSEIASKIEDNPYVESAKVERELNGNININIVQREVKYLINYSGEYIYIDKEGYILEINGKDNDNPILLGLSTDFSSLSIGNNKLRLNQDDLEKIKIINNIMFSLERNGVDNKINSIDATNKKDFILHLDNDGKTVYIGDGSDLTTRILYMKKILEAENEHTGKIYINGNLDEGYVYFKEQ